VSWRERRWKEELGWPTSPDGDGAPRGIGGNGVRSSCLENKKAGERKRTENEGKKERRRKRKRRWREFGSDIYVEGSTYTIIHSQINYFFFLLN
jgi:hypothetical protein